MAGSLPPPLDLPRLEAALPGPVVHLERCDSTNRVLAERAAGGAPAGTLVVAEAQTAGRGRLGRRWESEPRRNLLFSLLLRPAAPAAFLGVLGLSVGVALAEATGGLLKWPNDLLDAEGGKLGGVLASAETAPGDPARVRWVVVGVGLNVNQRRFPPGLHAASLAGDGPDLDRTELLVRVVRSVVPWAKRAERDPEAVLAAWRRRAATLGRRVRAEGVEGVAEDIRSDGALLVRTADRRLVPVLAGDVLHG